MNDKSIFIVSTRIQSVYLHVADRRWPNHWWPTHNAQVILKNAQPKWLKITPLKCFSFDSIEKLLSIWHKVIFYLIVSVSQKWYVYTPLSCYSQPAPIRAITLFRSVCSRYVLWAACIYGDSRIVNAHTYRIWITRTAFAILSNSQSNEIIDEQVTTYIESITGASS